MKQDKPKHNPSLTFDQAVEVWLLYWDGWLQSQIAAQMSTNPGRVNEILKERKHLGSRQAAIQNKSA